jgi:hypothetical protein
MTISGDGGLTFKKGTTLYESIKHKFGKWKHGNPGATPEAIAKRKKTFKKTKWVTGELHGNFGKHPKKPNLLGGKNHQAKSVVIDGNIFDSIISAAKVFNVHETTIKRRCNSSKFPNYQWVNNV